MWKFLLGVYRVDSTTEQRRALREAKAAEYAQLRQQWQTISRPQAQRFAKWREVTSWPCLTHARCTLVNESYTTAVKCMHLHLR